MGTKKRKFYQCIWHDKFPACRECEHNVPHKVPPRGTGMHCIDEGECTPVKGHTITCKCMVYVPDTDEDAYLNPITKKTVIVPTETKKVSRVKQWLSKHVG